MLTWDAVSERYYEHGVDRGVFHPKNPPKGPTVVQNLIGNPKPTAVYTGAGAQSGVRDSRWFGGGAGTYTVVTGSTPTGDNTFVRKTWTSAATNNGDTGFDLRPTNYGQALVAGQKLYVGAYLRPSSAKHAGSSVYYTEPGAREFSSNPSVALPANVWTWCKFLVTVSGSYHLATPTMDITGTDALWASGATLDICGIVFSIDQDFTGPFNGDTSDISGLYDYWWAGTPNASNSIKSQKVGTAIPWNGLTGFDESGNGTSEIMYRDGKVYLADMDATDFSGKLTAWTFPEEFSECLGMPAAGDGLYVDNQKPKRFDLSYRTLVGSGAVGDMFGYQIHLVYNAMASVGTKSRKTMSDKPELTEFTFDLVCTPIKLTGYRPTAHYILDTRELGPATLAKLEGILYGDATQAPRMPSPTELYDMLNYGDTITFVDNGDGTWTAYGSSDNIIDNGDGTFTIKNANVVDHGDGTFTFSDTP